MPRPSVNLRLLSAVGTALYGAWWQKAIAPDLKVSSRAIGRWVNEEYPLRDELPTGRPLGPSLLKLLQQRRDVIDKLITEVKETYDLK